MKKSVSLLLAALMLTGALAGCGSSASTSAGAQDSSAADTGVSGAVTVISREDGSGTRGAFVELTGIEEKNADGQKVDNTTADAEIANKTDVVLTSVAGNEKAIGYISEPHAAIAWRALRDQLQPGEYGLFLGTAHPAKFKESVEAILGETLPLPKELAERADLPLLSHNLPADFAALRKLMMG